MLTMQELPPLALLLRRLDRRAAHQGVVLSDHGSAARGSDWRAGASRDGWRTTVSRLQRVRAGRANGLG